MVQSPLGANARRKAVFTASAASFMPKFLWSSGPACHRGPRAHRLPGHLPWSATRMWWCPGPSPWCWLLPSLKRRRAWGSNRELVPLLLETHGLCHHSRWWTDSQYQSSNFWAPQVSTWCPMSTYQLRSQIRRPGLWRWSVNETGAGWQCTGLHSSAVSVCEAVTSKWKWKILRSWVRAEDPGTSKILTAVSECPASLFRPVKVSILSQSQASRVLGSVQLQANCSCHWPSTTQYFLNPEVENIQSVMSFFLKMYIACTSKRT